MRRTSAGSSAAPTRGFSSASPSAESTTPASSASAIVSLPVWNAQPPCFTASRWRWFGQGWSTSSWRESRNSTARAMRGSPGAMPLRTSERTVNAVLQTSEAKTSNHTPSGASTRRESSQSMPFFTGPSLVGRPAACSAESSSADCTVFEFMLPSAFWNRRKSSIALARSSRAKRPTSLPSGP